MRGIFYSLKDTLLFKINLEYSGIALRQFTHSAEIKQEISFSPSVYARVTEVRHIFTVGVDG